MNHVAEISRIIERANTAGHFQRDRAGNEHQISGYIIRFSYETQVRGQDEPVTNHETAVVIAPSSQAAKVAATKPYKNTNILSVDIANLSNPTILRMPV